MNQNNEPHTNKKIALVGLVVVIVGLIAAFLLVQQRQTLQRRAAEISCPDNRGPIDCFFEYKTYDTSGYNATLRDETGLVVGEKSGSLPNTNGAIANETASFDNQELGKTYKCTVKIITKCQETSLIAELTGENRCDKPDDTPTPTPTRGSRVGDCVEYPCACDDIVKGVTRYPTYYPRQPGIDDGRIILPTIDPAEGDTFCVNCSRIEMKDKKTGAIVITFPTATPDPARPGANACLNEDGKDVEREPLVDFRCHQGDISNSENGCREYEIKMTNTVKQLKCEKPEDEELPSKNIACGIDCKACCPTCTDPQPMFNEKKVCMPKAGMPNPEDHIGDPAYWICDVQVGQSCSPYCDIDFTSPAIDSYNAPGFQGGNQIPAVPGPGRGYPNNDPDKIAPACVAVGQNVVIKPKIGQDPLGGPGTDSEALGWMNWDEFDFGTKKPKPTEPATHNQPIRHSYTDPGTYDIKLVCKFPNGGDNNIEICTKRIAVTCNNPPGEGNPGNPPGGGGNPPPSTPGSAVCYDKCTANADCATGMTCHPIPGAGYSRCVKNPDDSCEDDQDCLCSNSCPLPKEVIGVCQ